MAPMYSPRFGLKTIESKKRRRRSIRARTGKIVAYRPDLYGLLEKNLARVRTMLELTAQY